MRTTAFSVLLGVSASLLLPPALAHAQQQTIQYDGVVTDAMAAITCGFCSGEKYGTIFYELNGGGGGLPVSAFPFTLDNVLIPIAATNVVLNTSTFMFECQPRATTGPEGVALEIYSGQTVPAAIEALPTGAWPGENTVLGPSSVQLDYSVENPSGSGQWTLNFNSIPIGVTISPPDTYVRVVVDVGTGGSSEACDFLGYQPPDVSPFRDDNGRVGARRNFIRELPATIPSHPERWQWTEQVSDPSTGATINGDWVIRLLVTPAVAPPVDAGVVDTGTPDLGTPDAGDGDAEPADNGPAPPPPDAGTPDSGVIVMMDAGTAPAPSITSISPDTGATAASTDVTVIGTDFQTGLTLKIGAIPASVRQLAGTTTIQATVPMGIASGVYDVVVTNPDGQSDILSDAFTIPSTTVTPTPQPPVEDSGCGCTTHRSGGSQWAVLLVAVGWALRRRR